jgi:hypothetical protein
MNDISIEPTDPGAPDHVTNSSDFQDTEAASPAMGGFKAADYCHLAEECFFLAAVTKDSEAAAGLVKAGDDYLRRASEWLADQLKAG